LYQCIAGGLDFNVLLRHKQKPVCLKHERLAGRQERPDAVEDPLHHSKRTSREQDEPTLPGKVLRCLAGAAFDDVGTRIDIGPRSRRAEGDPDCNSQKSLSHEDKPFCGTVSFHSDASGGLRHEHDILSGADVRHRG
jgi:hypothetical protein